MEEALTKGAAARASRCGAMRTRSVSRPTLLYLLRLRFLIEQPTRTPMLAEEVRVIGFAGNGVGRRKSGVGRSDGWLSETEALRLLVEAQPDANIGVEEKSNWWNTHSRGTTRREIHYGKFCEAVPRH